MPGVTEKVSRTEVAYLVARQFTSAFLRSHRLELAIHLLRAVDHPLLRERFLTTNRVMTHRLAIERLDQIDDDLVALIDEARGDVGLGTRGE